MKQTLLLLLFFCLSANAQHKFTVYFDFDIAEVNTASTQTLSKWIADNPRVRIQKIYGYADKTGDVLYNQDLSERRALYVYEQLKAGKLMLEYAEQKGFGENQSTAAHNAKDRKVVIEYARPEIQPAPEQSELNKEISKAKKGDKILLKNVNFYNNSDEMISESRPVMAELIAILKANPKLKIQIQGHVCCQVESALKLSQLRAIAVYKGLVANGIDAKRLSYTSFGSTRPLYPLPEKNEEERSANRRVEIEIVEN